MSNNRVFSFDGDFVRQAEFIPIENLAEVKARLTSFGAIDIKDGGKEYNFRPFSILLEIKNISFKDIALSIRDFLQPYDKVVFDISPEETESEMFAFGDERLALWGGKESPTSDKVVWLEFVKLNNVSTSGDIVKNDQILNNFSQAVYSIGVKNALLLVDLDTRKVVDCSNILEVYEYFRNW